MTLSSTPKYAQMPLHQLAEMLNIDYYNVLLALCNSACEKLLRLKQLDINNVIAEYFGLCDRLLMQLKLDIADRQDFLVPYLKTLHEKESANHNCANCSGNCDMQHSAHLIALQESHKQIHQLLHTIQVVQIPALQNAPYHHLYQGLFNEMKLVDTVICDLLSLESASLVPAIITTQKKINVNS